MTSEKKVINILTIIITLFIYSYSISSEPKKYSNLEMLYEDPLVFETWEFTREFYKQSEYIENDKEICNFLSSNWKYEDHHIFIEYIFATKNYSTRKINLYKIILFHDETEFKSYKHDIEGAWVVILFEKMKPYNALLINDEGIGSNRIVMSNHYLNTYNYYHKNVIKMNKILELKNHERKKILEKFRKDKEIPGLMFSTAYYKYTGNDFEYFENDKNNVAFKSAKINYLQDLVNNIGKNVKLKLVERDHKNKGQYKLFKNLSLSKGLTHDYLPNEEKKQSNKNKIYNYNQINKIIHNDDFLASNKYNNLIKSKNIKCRIMFGKTLHNDSEFQKKEKNQIKNLSYNKNENINNGLKANNYTQTHDKEFKSKR